MDELKKILSRWCGFIPCVYDNSMTVYELLCKLLHLGEKIIEESIKIYETVGQLKDDLKQLEDYIKNYDENIKNDVNDFLSLYVKSDEFKSIIQEIVAQSINFNVKNCIVDTVNTAPYEIYEIAKSYLDNVNNLYYGVPSFIGYDYDEETNTFKPQDVYGKYSGDVATFPLVCSTLVWLCLLGVPYEKCRINTGSISTAIVDGDSVPLLTGGTNTPNSGMSSAYLTSKAMTDYWGASGHGTIYSANTAKLLNDCGLLHRVSAPYSELAPGDILFYTNLTEGEAFEQINHDEIFLGWHNNRLLVLSTDNDTGAQCINYFDRAPGSDFVSNYLKYYARIPKSGKSVIKNLLEKNNKNYGNLSARSSITMGFDDGYTLSENTCYPVYIVCENKVPEGTYFNVYGNHNGTINNNVICQIFSNVSGHSLGNNTYYGLMLIPTGITNINGITIYAQSGDVNIKNIMVYDKLTAGVVETTKKVNVKTLEFGEGSTLTYYLYGNNFTIKGRGRFPELINANDTVFQLENMHLTLFGSVTNNEIILAYGSDNNVYPLLFNTANYTITAVKDIPALTLLTINSVLPILD